MPERRTKNGVTGFGVLPPGMHTLRCRAHPEGAQVRIPVPTPQGRGSSQSLENLGRLCFLLFFLSISQRPREDQGRCPSSPVTTTHILQDESLWARPVWIRKVTKHGLPSGAPEEQPLPVMATAYPNTGSPGLLLLHQACRAMQDCETLAHSPSLLLSS